MGLLTQKYVWEDFLRDIGAYVSKNFESLVGVPVGLKFLAVQYVLIFDLDEQ